MSLQRQHFLLSYLNTLAKPIADVSQLVVSKKKKKKKKKTIYFREYLFMGEMSPQHFLILTITKLILLYEGEMCRFKSYRQLQEDLRQHSVQKAAFSNLFHSSSHISYTQSLFAFAI